MGLTEGNIFQGELSLEQLFFNRPVPGYARFRTPVRDLWLCGSSAHPGGGIMGAPGRIAALEVLRSRRRTVRAGAALASRRRGQWRWRRPPFRPRRRRDRVRTTRSSSAAATTGWSAPRTSPRPGCARWCSRSAIGSAARSPRPRSCRAHACPRSPTRSAASRVDRARPGSLLRTACGWSSPQSARSRCGRMPRRSRSGATRTGRPSELRPMFAP